MTRLAAIGGKRIWQFLRALLGDDSYERYCEHARACHPGIPVLDRRAYYLQAQEHKWGGINRCC